MLGGEVCLSGSYVLVLIFVQVKELKVLRIRGAEGRGPDPLDDLGFLRIGKDAWWVLEEGCVFLDVLFGVGFGWVGR